MPEITGNLNPLDLNPTALPEWLRNRTIKPASKACQRTSSLAMPQGAIGTGCVMMVEVAPLAAAFSA